MTRRPKLPAVGHPDRPAPDPHADRAARLQQYGLDHIDPITAPPDTELIAAAAAYARRGDGGPESRLLWGRYAYTASRTLWGFTHPVTLRMVGVFEAVLAAQQLTFDVVRLCEDRVAAYRHLDQPDQVTAARCSLVMALHRDGQCDNAEHEIADVLQTQADGHAPARRSPSIVLSYAVVLAGCGTTGRAVCVLQDHADLLIQLTAAEVQATAGWLAATERAHHAVCQHRCTGRMPPDVAGRRLFWLAQLTNLTPPPIPQDSR